MSLRVRLSRRELDREIADGVPVETDPARAARAEQLLTARKRLGLAACLSNILRAADERHADPASILRLNHAEVLAAHHDLTALIGALRSEQRLAVRGLARARLLTEDDSPLLVARRDTTVSVAVREVIRAV